RVSALVKDHQRAKCGSFKAPGRNDVHRDPAVFLLEVKIAKHLKRSTRESPLVRFDLLLDLARKVANAGSTLRTDGRLAASDNIDPGTSIDPVIFTGRDIALHIPSRGVLFEIVGNDPFLLA